MNNGAFCRNPLKPCWEWRADDGDGVAVIIAPSPVTTVLLATAAIVHAGMPHAATTD
jgi:hypothetical protein